MVLRCFTWIHHFFRQLIAPFTFHDEVFEPLSDDIISDILTRLPAESLLRCRAVCRRWRELISSINFTRFHLDRAAPSLFVQCYEQGNLYKRKLNLYIFDEHIRKDKGITVIRSTGNEELNSFCPVFAGSCDGLVLFRSTLCMSMLFVVNPVTREEVSVTGPSQPGYLCGIYFHRLTQNYKLLYAYKWGSSFRYLTYNLMENIWRDFVCFSYLPQLKSSAPAMVNGSIYWMIRHAYRNINNVNHCLNAIMILNTDTEAFSVMPHPGSECRSSKDHRKIQLLVSKEHLCLCQLDGRFLRLWVLADSKKWDWVLKFRVDLHCDLRLFSRNFGAGNYYVHMKMKILGIQNDELVVVWDVGGLYRYNLVNNSVRKVATKKGELVNHLCYASIYTKSLVKISSRRLEL